MQAADRGSFQGWWSPSGRDGTRLSHWLWSQHAAAWATDDLQWCFWGGRVWQMWPAGIFRMVGIIHYCSVFLFKKSFQFMTINNVVINASKGFISENFLLLQVSLLQVFMSCVVSTNAICLQTALPRTAIHEHHPSPQTGSIQRVKARDYSNSPKLYTQKSDTVLLMTA